MSQVLPRDFGLPQPKPKKRAKQIKPYKWRQATPIKPVGKVTKKWKSTREEWFKANADKSNWLGYFACHYCGQWFPKSQLDLDHRLRRGSHPEARFDLSNLVPADRACHIKKDSGFK